MMLENDSSSIGPYIMAIILVLIFVNSFIIESYYLYYKKDTLLGSYTKINKYLLSNMSTILLRSPDD